MAQLTVRHVRDQIVRALRQRAAASDRSAEAEHREARREALADEEDFATRAKALRRRLPSTVTGSEIIRADRDLDTAA